MGQVNCCSRAETDNNDKILVESLARGPPSQNGSSQIRGGTSKLISEARSVLKNIPIFATLHPEEINCLLEAMELVSYNDGTYLYKEGDPPDYFYILVDGTAHCLQRTETTTMAAPTPIKRFRPGDYFGELQLLTNQCRRNSVLTKGHCQLLRLHRTDFELLLGPCEMLLKRNIHVYRDFAATIRSARDEQLSDTRTPRHGSPYDSPRF